MMRCKQIQDMMGAYIYGDLTPDEMKEVRTHTQECSHCRADLESRTDVISAVASCVPQLSETEKQKMEWFVKGSVDAQQRSFKGLRLVPVFVAALLIVMAVFAFGTLMGRHFAKDGTANLVQTPSARVETPTNASNRAHDATTEDVVKVPLEDEEKEPALQRVEQAPEETSKPIKTNKIAHRAADAASEVIRRSPVFAITHRNQDARPKDRQVKEDKPVDVVKAETPSVTETKNDLPKLPRADGPKDARLASPELGN